MARDTVLKHPRPVVSTADAVTAMAPAKLDEMPRSPDSGYQSKLTTPRTSSSGQSREYERYSNESDAGDLDHMKLGQPPPDKDVDGPPPLGNTQVDIFESTEPQVPALQKLRFLGWCASVTADQCWKDTKKGQMPSILATPYSRDLFSHFVMVPLANKEPRLLASGPRDHIELYRLEDTEAYRDGRLASLAGRPTLRLTNLASNNYGGFAQLETGAPELLRQALRALPMTPVPPALEAAVRREFLRFFAPGFGACALASSGFSCNMVAFGAVVDAARARGRRCVFLCDRDSHSSMWTGAYANREATTLKFDHNSAADLEAQLRRCRREWPGALVCVAIEGTYSMEGSVPPLPAILALKKAYGFALLVDEAHSFLGLGASGRGSFEYWQDQGFDCPLAEADLMTCTFSKSAGCLGGAVLANGDFADHLRPEADGVVRGGGHCGKGIASVVLVRVLQLLRKTNLIRHRMELLKHKSFYVARRLASAGCRILGSPGSPNVCFPVGTMHRLSSCIKDSIESGVALSCGIPPATTLWCCRVRASIFATMSWEDIDRAVVQVARIGAEHGVPGMHTIEADPDLASLEKSTQCSEDQAAILEMEAAWVDRDIQDFIRGLGENTNQRAVDVDGGSSGLGRDPAVLDAGDAALRRYGVGPCSARHYYGAFDTYVELEKRLAKLYPCLSKQAGGHCEALLCGDAQICIGSAVAARAQVPRRADAYTLVLVPASSPRYIAQALAAVKESPRCVIETYDSTLDLVRIIDAQHRRQRDSGRKTCHLTLLVRTSSSSGDEKEAPLDLPEILRSLAALGGKKKKQKILGGVTVLLDDTSGLGRLGPRRLGYLDELEARRGSAVLAEAASAFGRRSRSRGGSSPQVQIAVIGAWYEAFRHCGGYMIGSKALMDSWNFQNRGFIFSAPPLPLQTAMTSKALQILEGKSGSTTEGRV